MFCSGGGSGSDGGNVCGREPASGTQSLGIMCLRVVIVRLSEFY